MFLFSILFFWENVLTNIFFHCFETNQLLEKLLHWASPRSEPVQGIKCEDFGELLLGTGMVWPPILNADVRV